jgi:hypothetical protein
MLTIEYNTMDRTQDHGTSVEEDVKEEVFFLNLLSSLLSRNTRKTYNRIKGGDGDKAANKS